MGKQIILFAMARINHHYQKLNSEELFSEVARRVASLPSKQNLLDLGVGDTTVPLFPTVVAALENASRELGLAESFRGYGPAQGYEFLRKAISENEYKNISADEIFISDGAHNDLADLQEIFSIDNKVAIQDPAYPVYVETNVMAGRTRPLLKTGVYGGVAYLACDEKNGFQPELPTSHVDLIYLCSPSNPTGVALTKECLTRFVKYAKEHKSVIFFDGTYEAFITGDAPRSIYEIEGAREVAIEVRTFSKSAGFSALRCSYTVVPKTLKIHDAGALHSLHTLWSRRVETKSNGVSYPIQKAAESLYTETGKKIIKDAVNRIHEKAKLLKEGLKALGYTVYGGIDAPYVWCKTPPRVTSWEFFDFLLENAGIITLPGGGFGKSGDGYVRLSAFAEVEVIEETIQRFKRLA